MIFFTDINTEASNYCLLNINKYFDQRKANKKLIMIDPGVYELVKSNEYKNISMLHQIAGKGILKENEYISIDYPCDMNKQYTSEFIQKSVKNNFTYAEVPRYICTIQYEFLNFDDFKYRFTELEPVFRMHPEKIIGFGNMCRLINGKHMDTWRFVDCVFNHALRNLEKGRWIHIYGAPMWMIREWVPKLEQKFKVSVDSTKFTKAVTNELKAKYGLNCKKSNRDEFFTTYMREIENEGILVDS